MQPLRLPIVFIAFLSLVVPVSAGRYEQHTQKAAQGPHAQPVAATFFGGPGYEEFVAVDALPDGRIIAFGNAGGPTFPDTPKPTVLGKGEHRGLEAMSRDKRGKELARGDNPDLAGFMVWYSPDLKRVERVVRFDWGVGTINAAGVMPGGKEIIIAGRATQAMRELGATAAVRNDLEHPAEERPEDPKKAKRWKPRYGSYTYEGVELPGDVYVASLSPDGSKLNWIWVLQGLREPPQQLWLGQGERAGDVWFQTDGLKHITAGGKSIQTLAENAKGGKDDNVGIRAVNPRTGEFVYAGDRNTHTGREPWRQPFLVQYDARGNEETRLWGWDSKLIGTDKYRLVSDSSIRDGVYDFSKVGDGGGSEGGTADLILAGWSDGGNSVFKRMPKDLDKAAPDPAFIESVWGMKSANSIAYLLRLDGKTLEQQGSTYWVGFIPETFDDRRVRGAPNGAGIGDMTVLGGGAVAITGGAATGLIQTPNAFVQPPKGPKYGGAFATLFSPQFDRLLFSSYLPGSDDARVARVPGGAVVVSRTTGDDGRDPATPSPTLDAVQPTFGGGSDGHIVLIKLPAEKN